MVYFAFPTRRRTAFSILSSIKYLLDKITQLFFVDSTKSVITQLDFVDSAQSSITRLDMVE